MTNIDLAGLRILVVDDEVMIADETAEELQKCGAEVLGPATRLEQAEKLADGSGPIDAAVLDINLRGQMVYSLADRLIARGVRVVFTTGYDRFVVPERFADVARCEKPVRPDDLLQVLGRLGTD